jgi:membrane-anchored protein YejM (alkaline phosphatase superfamily)
LKEKTDFARLDCIVFVCLFIATRAIFQLSEACSAERALAIVRMRLPLNGSASYSLAAEL